MKKLLIAGTLLLMLCAAAYAQQPKGMKYQAVARDQTGAILANKKIALKITLGAEGAGGAVYYTEQHEVVTTPFGLFDLVIGEGKPEYGTFAGVPWSEANIWMQVAIRGEQRGDFVVISNSRLLAVPYAFHALTANELVSKSLPEKTAAPNSTAQKEGVPSQNWSLFGNSKTDPATDKLGTTDLADLVIITNNTERLRITKEGDIAIKNNLAVGNNATIGNDLTVKQNAYLNTMGGQTINNGDFTVANEKTTLLTGALQVNGLTALKNASNSSTPADGALVVTGGTGIGKNLNVGGNLSITGTAHFGGNTTFGSKVNISDPSSSTSPADGALTVAGGVGIGKELNVGGVSSFLENASFKKDLASEGTVSSKSLMVSNNNEQFLATFENTNGNEGDGIRIKLGRTHSAYNGSGYLNITNPGVEAFQQPINTIRGWVIDRNPFQPTDIINLFPASLVAGTACQLVNLLTDKINDGIPLPVNFPEIQIIGETTLVPGIDFGALGSTPDVVLPALSIPGFQLIPEIPDIDCSILPSFSVPNISFTDVSNSLTNKNQYISFVDKENRELGSVRAQSVNDWSANYLDGAYFVQLMANIAGIDLVSAIAGAVAGFTDIAKSYNSIGVEYASGHADYAEWMERADNNESIDAGHVVGVKGGKISKDLNGAEQIMVVSTNPIMLGNAPELTREPEGEKVAFMGQVPVNVIGPVAAGDFIVANPATPGYGRAVAPASITAQQLFLTIGRALESRSNGGTHSVNTLIGIDKADYVKVIESMDARLQSLETKLETILSGFRKYAEDVKKINEKQKLETETRKAALKKKVEEEHKKDLDDRRKKN